MLPHHLDPAWWDSSDLVSLEVRLFSLAYMVFPLGLLLLSLQKLSQLRRAHRAALAAASSPAAGATRVLPKPDSKQLAELSTTQSVAPAQAWQQPGQAPRTTPAELPDAALTARFTYPVPVLWRHKSLLLLLVSSLAGSLGTAWCLNNVVQGAAADMNTTFASPLLAALYLATMAYGRLKTQHQLLKLGISMMSKSGQVGRSALQRRQDVRRFSIVLHIAWVVTGLMYATAVAGIVMGMVDNRRLRRWCMMMVALSVMLLTVCGPGSSIYLVTRILHTLKEHARALEMTMTSKQPKSNGNATQGSKGTPLQTPRTQVLVNTLAITQRLVSDDSTSPADDSTHVLVNSSRTPVIAPSSTPAPRRAIQRAPLSSRATVADSSIIEVVIHASPSQLPLASPTHTTPPPIEPTARSAIMLPFRSPSPTHNDMAVQLATFTHNSLPPTHQQQSPQQQPQTQAQLLMPRPFGRHSSPVRRRTVENLTPSVSSYVAAEAVEAGRLARTPCAAVGEPPVAPSSTSSSRRHIRYSSTPASPLPPRHEAHTGGATGATLVNGTTAAGSPATVNSIFGSSPPQSRRSSFSQLRADATAIAIGVSGRPHSQGQQQPPAQTATPAQPDSCHLSAHPSSVSQSSVPASAPAPASASAPASHSEQMQIWQDKLSVLKKSLVPIALTFGMATCILTVPWLSSHITYTFPMCMVATNMALIVATKQLPIDL